MLYTNALALEWNAFSAGDECDLHGRQSRLLLEMNGVKTRARYTLHLIGTVNPRYTWDIWDIGRVAGS